MDNGIPKKGARLLAWTNAADDTYLRDPIYWTTEYAFNLTQSLFVDAPEFLATWHQTVQSDARVVAHREAGRWKEAWDLVLEAIVLAHTGDRFAAQRLSCQPPTTFVQSEDKLVATMSQDLVEEDQSRSQLGLWNHVGTLLADLDEDWKRAPTLSMFGLDSHCREGKDIHQYIMDVLQGYRDTARAFELYGALRPEIQTHIETTLGQAILNHGITLEMVRTADIAHEGREKAHLEDFHRQIQKLGVTPAALGRHLIDAADVCRDHHRIFSHRSPASFAMLTITHGG